MTRKALVVGINNYGPPNDVSSPARDADAFAATLEQVYRFDQVRVLRDSEATRDGVDRGLDWLFQAIGGSDRLVLYFSGLGHRYERGGVVQDALVLQDGRLLENDELFQRIEGLPQGVLTIVLDCSFSSGLDTLLVLPGGQVEVARIKRWIAPDVDRLRQQRDSAQRAGAFRPFGHTKPVDPETLVSAFRSLSLDPSPARVAPITDPRWHALVITPCLEDEAAVAATSQTGGLSAFTHCLLDVMRRLGPNRSAIEVLQTTGQDSGRLGLRQTPVVKEPLQPEHLSLRAFLTFQPALFVRSPTPGGEADDPRNRSIAEAIRNTVEGFKEGRQMQTTIGPGQTMFGDDVGTIVNTVTPIVASILQSRAQAQPGLGGYSHFGGQFQPFPGAAYLAPWPYAGLQPPWAYQQPQFQFGPAHGGYGFGQGGFGQGPWGQSPGGSLPPHELAQVVSIVTPVVASILQTRAYQMPLGYGLPRAA